MATDNAARSMANSALKIANGMTALKSNLTATSAPTTSDDLSLGYKEGSTWVYNNTTYTCVNSTVGNAVWTSSQDIFYFDTWIQLVAAITVVGTTYVGKFASVANANGAPSSGLNYTAPNALTDYIVDGGSAIFKINKQGTTYSVTCQIRTITNPVVTSVMLITAAKPTTKGYYIFSVNPVGGLPSGVGLNDIAYFNGTTWSVWQSYSQASAVLVAGTTTNTQVTWRKFNGTWMSTADSYNPDGLEYQTGKLWNGKAVYRKCIEGTTALSTGTYSTSLTIPTTGKALIILGSLKRISGTEVPIPSIAANGGTFTYAIDSNGVLKYEIISDTGFCNRPFTAWVEYTKS